jgi:hypothetical protein
MRTSERVFFKLALVVCALLLLGHVVARAYLSATSEPERILTTFNGSTELVGPAGILLAITVIVAALIFLLRIGPAERLVVRYNLKWAKPYLAAGLGSVLGAASTWIVPGANSVWGASLSGLVAGLGAVGLHQILTIHDGGRQP